MPGDSSLWQERAGDPMNPGRRLALSGFSVDGVGDTGRLESPQTEDAAIAATAGAVAVSVARPGEMKRGAQLQAEPDDLPLVEVDHRGQDSDPRLRAGTGIRRTRERVKKRLRTVGVPGTVFFDSAQIDTGGANGLGPGNAEAEKKGIPERHIRCGDVVPVEVGVGNWNLWVRQGGTADLTECVGPCGQAAARGYFVMVGDFQERTVFTGVCALAVVDKEEGKIVVLTGDGGGNATVQTAAEQDNGKTVHARLTVAAVRFAYDARSSISEYTVGRRTSVRMVDTISPAITTKPIGPQRRAVPSAVP